MFLLKLERFIVFADWGVFSDSRIEDVGAHSQQTLIFWIFGRDRWRQVCILEHGYWCASSFNSGVAVELQIVARIQIYQFFLAFSILGVLFFAIIVFQFSYVFEFVVALFGSFLDFVDFLGCLIHKFLNSTQLRFFQKLAWRRSWLSIVVKVVFLLPSVQLSLVLDHSQLTDFAYPNLKFASHNPIHVVAWLVHVW